jgi:hypothetical protein
MPFGLWLLLNLDARLMKGILGIVVLFGVFLSIKGFDLQRLPKQFDYAMGVIAGVLSTATSTRAETLEARSLLWTALKNPTGAYSCSNTTVSLSSQP